MTIISVQSHYGGAATFGIGRGAPSSNLNVLSPRSTGIAPSVKAFGSQYSGAAGAISKIIDIISNMDSSDAGDLSSGGIGLTGNEKRGVDRFSKMVERANYTKEDVIEYLQSDEFNHLRTDNAPDVAMREALANGTATVIDMEELGYRTEVSINMHFDADGSYSGSSTTYQRDGSFDLNKFYEEHMIQQADGTIIDGETGHHANRVQIGAVDLYITWP
ncbi:MAG: hypothetical protein COB78_03800 [Hyphomicrobiales bacterium]|nr:MAG: hypothetical protein COB78_03800 [Hyphomicrobiales bacterium]